MEYLRGFLRKKLAMNKDHWNFIDGPLFEEGFSWKDFGIMVGAALILALAIFGLMNIL